MSFDITYYKTIDLERLKFTARGIVSDKFMRDVESECYFDNTLQHLVLILRKEVMAQELDCKTFKKTVKIPGYVYKTTVDEYASWFDHLVGTKLPWLKRYYTPKVRSREVCFNVEERTVDAEIEARFMATYPECDYAFPPDEMHPVVHKIVEA